jgi:hypothetical protein
MSVHAPLLLAQVIVDALRIGLVVAMVAMLIGLYRVGRASRRAPAALRERSRLIDLAGNGLLGLTALASIGVLVVLFTCGYDGGAAKGVPPGFLEVTRDGDDPICGPLDPRGAAILVEVVHSDDKKRWIEGAASEFMRRCPQIQLRLTALDDLDAADAILRGDRRPTLWAPLDELSLRYLADRWTARSDELLLRADEQRPLLNSPLVLLLWKDRLRALAMIRGEGGDADRAGPGFWVDVACPRVPLAPSGSPLSQAKLVPGGWREWYESRIPAPAAPPPQAGTRTGALLTTAPPEDPQAVALQAWGRVKFAAASPAHSTGGAAVLFLMASQYMSTTRPGDTAGFAAALERDADGLHGWLRRCQAGLDGPEASRGLAEMLLDIGPSGLDGVFTYEHLAVPVLQQMGDPGLPELRVLYPQPTLVANHPAVLLWPDDPRQTAARDAARRWLDFLESDAVQRDAVPFGLRPAKLTGSVGGFDLINNPFRGLRRFGVETDPVLKELGRPDGRSFHALLELWQAATGRD